jgi:hypothetical protein
MINIFFDDPLQLTTALTEGKDLTIFSTGSAFAYITSAVLFTFLFKRRLALTLVSIQFVALVINAGFLFMNYLIPSYDLNDMLMLP